jgi:hypothetical protein
MKLLTAAIALSACFSAPAIAGTFSACTVVSIIVIGDQNAHIQLNCPAAFVSPPACSLPGYVGFDKSTPAGKQYLSLFTYAHAVGGKVGGNIDSTYCSPFQTNVALMTAMVVSN